jgi:heme-degrading monooxygenase HmoA
MILEIATFHIQEGKQTDFEAAFQKAKLVISQSKGFLDLTLQHCLEIPTKYKALIHWETLEDHMIRFRESVLFTE